MTAERQAIKVLADEMMKAIKKVTEDNNKSYVANKIKNYNGGTVIGGGGSSGGSISGDINASQVKGLYNAVASYIINAPTNASSGDTIASNIMGMFNSTIDGRFDPDTITVKAANVQNLKASFAEFINLVSQKATIQDLDVEKIYADIADIGISNIGNAKITYAQIRDTVSDTAIIREGLGSKLYIDKLAVTDANMVSLTTGELMIKDSDGDFARIVVDSSGNVSSQKVDFNGDSFIRDNTVGSDKISSLNGGKIIENTITARELNVSSIFADNALIGAIKAANIDVASLFASEGFISSLTTSVIQSPSIGSGIDLSQNSSITLTNQKIDMLVSSESSQSSLVLTNNMINAISSQVTFSADRINFNASENFNAAVSSRVKDELGYRLEVTSTSEILTDSITATILTAKVYQGKNDVTNLFAASQFNWKRVSSNPTGDTTWNNDSSHKGKKQITILTSDVDYSATFTCELNDGLDEGQEA